ncbi:MAG: hypothetical protein J6Y25_07150 [Elusimicrobiaceae bacterium]|nr:hypothetical protein [Elusimicrobiaceae bacterium]MBP5617385.1 hypothetical protein [Elusimicrobiaceae bacterium]
MEKREKKEIKGPACTALRLWFKSLGQALAQMREEFHAVPKHNNLTFSTYIIGNLNQMRNKKKTYF